MRRSSKISSICMAVYNFQSFFLTTLLPHTFQQQQFMPIFSYIYFLIMHSYDLPFWTLHNDIIVSILDRLMEYSGKQSSMSSVGGSKMVQIPKVKVVVVGVSGVGKTSISQRFVNNQYNSRSPATLGASFIEKLFQHPPGRSFRLQIWDTAGQEKYRAIAKIYYKDARVAVLVYDVTDQLSFTCMKEWGEDVLNNANKDVLLAVVGNKTDLLDDPEFDPSKQVNYQQAKAYAQSIGAIFHTTSAKDNKGINELFSELCEVLSKRDSVAQPVTTVPLGQPVGRGSKKRCCKQ